MANDKSSELSDVENPREEEKRLATLKETKAVKYLKWMLLPILVCTAVIMSVGTYVLIRENEKDDFEMQF